jgi:hypothetical protein
MMIRKMTDAEIESRERRAREVGAIGRNAIACKCGHIDYRPNAAMFQDCVFETNSCLECQEPVKSH